MDMRVERRALDKLYKRRDRYEIPDWQRDEVWGLEKKRRLIDSILRGWKLPKFYFQRTHVEPEEYDVVDGQQRLAAIMEFFDNDLSLSDESAKRFGGYYYRDIPDSVSDRFDDYEIEYDEITNATDKEIKEFFQRLQEGLPLTSSEKLNAEHSKLRDFCANTANHPFFSTTTVIANKRYAYFDIVAKVAVLEIEGVDASLRYSDVHSVFVANKSFSPNSAAAKRIRSALSFLAKCFPKSCKAFRHRTIVQSIITFICHLQDVGLKAEHSETIRDFVEHFLRESSAQVELGQQATDQDFMEFHRTVNANVKSGARVRQTVLLGKLFQRHPDFFSALSNSAKLTDRIVTSIENAAVSIRELIAQCNELYAARNGEDLFKSTNKTTHALVSLGTSIDSISGYKDLIDNLYFVFREGCGQRIGTLPDSFVDVNYLRTMLQHDVDHGKHSKVSTKRKQLGATFSKYSGVTSPGAIDPAAFLLVQSNILRAIRSDLSALSRSLI